MRARSTAALDASSGSSTGSAWKSRSSAWKTFGRLSPSAAPARRSSFSIRRSVCSSPSSSSTSSSSKLRVTRWWSRTATESCTISAPFALTPSRRVRSLAIGRSVAPRRCPRRSASSSPGARPASRLLQLEPGAPLRQLQLPETLAVLDPVAQRHAAAREAVVGGVVVGRDEQPRLDRLAAELGQPELARRTQLHLPLDASRESPSAESRQLRGEEAVNACVDGRR